MINDDLTFNLTDENEKELVYSCSIPKSWKGKIPKKISGFMALSISEQVLEVELIFDNPSKIPHSIKSRALLDKGFL
ncbi:MAG: hypothetical protein ABIH65_03975 [Nanoarchaeota archaeon]